ncbi:PREDICTED: probable Werner syndrome ATP-dependent helicase homolog 1 [Branchiostoma belcheri]|uniref:DNA 3'-5' helicase n=1 Tax=Branchiostoma belcheri TaxID=7741 RepID=A0A6P5A2Y6_BRABE|nr:PREDICTED: probable Werner syndrome ATP-dependent helicase homolog 1 [Branchiostoma belcheri]
MVVVISPLQALVADQVRRYNIKTGYRAVSLSGSDAIAAFRENPDPGTRLVFMAPEDATSTAGRQFIANTPIKLGLVAIDEAHCIPEWGEDFRRAFRMIGTLRAVIPDVPFMALTATATEAVRSAVQTELHLTGEVVMGDLNRENITISRIQSTSMTSDFQPLVEDLQASGRDTKKHLIYLPTKQKCMAMFELLQDAVQGRGLVEVFHADLSPAKKKKVLEGLQAGDVRVVIATVAFGMGIDIPDVSCVISYGAPASVSQLYQQMGRAGRSSEVEAAYLVYHTTKEHEKAKPEVASILTEEGCLRKALLKHLGQSDMPQQDQCCSNCGGLTQDASCLLSERLPPAPKARKKPRPHREKTDNGGQLKQKLQQLRDQEFNLQPQFCFFGPCAVMTDETIDRLLKYCHRLHTKEDVKSVKGVSSTMVDSILAAIDEFFPEKSNQRNPPRRQGNPPRRQGNPPRRQGNPPRRQGNPPRRERIPPVRTTQGNPPETLRRSKRQQRNPLQEITNHV